MSLSGTWKHRLSSKTLEIFGPLPEGGDSYYLKYYDEIEDKEFCNEKVQIFITNENHALLAHSEFFGRQDVYFVSKDCIRFKGLFFDRIIN